ncbi:MAG TPA: 3-deoxy-D-manno-octulosonic acid transferase, partial [Pyrinomonadaceae bacterium]|nr:3-deoxy-D-manno-octulosonic acid transferase [Pyrinomonadaceae bacterium]
MYFLYSLLLSLGFAVLLPRFLLDLARHGKYAAGLRERAGFLPRFDPPGGKKIIWLHCVSVGETQAARPLARALLDAHPAHALVVSTTTETGQRVAREAFDGVAARVFYFPFDWAWSVRRALVALDPSAVVVMETELWPRFFRECRRRGVPVALVNGRISQTSFRRYGRIKFFIRRVLADLSLAAMQSEEDAARIRALGLDPRRVVVTGNVKFDADTEAGAQALTDELRGRFHFGNGRPVVAAASTHAPEERVVLEAFKELVDERLAEARPRLLIAPRHPERFAEVAALVESSGLSWSRRSARPSERDAGSDVVLLDTVGELRAVYPLTDVVFVGGSVAPKGGHNVLEPAAAAKCVVTGAHTSNFKAITKAFLERDALVQLPAVEAAEAAPVLARVLGELLDDRGRRARLGENARRALDE